MCVCADVSATVTVWDDVLQDDEYVVYSTGQVMLRYVVQFTVEEDRLREFTPSIETSLSPALYDTCQGNYIQGFPW